MPASVTERESVRWYPVSVIEKYSADQTAWAQERLRGLTGWGRLPLHNRVQPGDRRCTVRAHRGVGLVRDLHGDWLRELFPGGPEDGLACDEGNLTTSAGLTQIISMLTGAAQSVTVRYLTNAQTVVGVGTNQGGNGPAAAVTDLALADDNTASAYYQGADSTYPFASAPATIQNQCTFGPTVANFAWNEWLWATGQAITAGTHLAAGGVFATLASAINHKVKLSAGGIGASLGSKGSGSSWVFATTVVFS